MCRYLTPQRRGPHPIAGIQGKACQSVKGEVVIRVGGSRRFKVRQRLVFPMLLRQDIRAGDKRFGIVGMRGKGGGVGTYGIIRPVEREQGVPEIDVGLSKVWPDLNRFLVLAKRLVAPVQFA